MLLRLIERAAENGTLANAPFYWDIARSWNLLGTAGKAKSWLSAGMESSAEFLAKVTLGFVIYSEAPSGRSYSMEERPDEAIYDLNVVLAACKKHLGGRDLDEDQRRRVEAVAEAIRQIILANQASINDA
jgi:hypothetical protein